tara:strand:+ start:971 stop:1303 length:333 start_codon:yes stop_codon:yes gene_type:complete
MNWKDLNSIDDLNAAIAASDNGLVVLFKHSTRCSISRMALKMLEMGWDDSLAGVEAYYLDLLNHRDVSSAIADKLNIEHQSPQMLVLSGGKVHSISNHSDINTNEVKKHL